MWDKKIRLNSVWCHFDTKKNGGVTTTGVTTTDVLVLKICHIFQNLQKKILETVKYVFIREKYNTN